jgi:hypothetical protein
MDIRTKIANMEKQLEQFGKLHPLATALVS